MVTAKGSARRPLVWVVEDDVATRDLVRSILTENDFDAVGFNSAEDAYRELEKKQGLPALVLVDLMLPGMGGMDMIRLMKDRAEWSHIPVVVVTSMSRQEAAGAEKIPNDGRWLSKPVDGAELISTVKGLLR